MRGRRARGPLLGGRASVTTEPTHPPTQPTNQPLCQPQVVRMKDDIKNFLTSKGVHWEEVRP